MPPQAAPCGPHSIRIWPQIERAGISEIHGDRILFDSQPASWRSSVGAFAAAR